MILAYINGDTASIIPEGQDFYQPTPEGDIRTSYGSLLSWSTEELSAVGLVKLDEPPPPPHGFRSTGTTVFNLNGEWMVNHQLVPLDVVTEKVSMLARLADARWAATQTFTYDGVLTQADSSVSVITGKVVASQMGVVTFPMVYKLGPNQFRSWSFEDLVAFGQAVNDHIQGCFDKEQEVAAQIMADNVSLHDAEAILAAVTWP